MGRPTMITGMLAALLVALPTALAAQRGHDRGDDDFRSRIDTTLTLDRDGTVALELVSGEIIVTPSSGNEVRVRATSEDGLLRLDASPSRISLNVRSDHGEMGDTRYEVSIPATARLIMRSVSGDLTARGGSEVDAHTVSGDVDVSDATGRATVESISGDVHASHLSGGLRASSVSGDVRLSDIAGDVDVESTSGEIELANVRSSFVRTETVSGDTRFSGTIDPKGSYDFHAHSGDIRLMLPATGATLNIQTFSGDVDSDYPMTLEPGAQRESGKHLSFTINGGGARVTAQTFSGDVTIERATTRDH